MLLHLASSVGSEDETGPGGFQASTLLTASSPQITSQHPSGHPWSFPRSCPDITSVRVKPPLFSLCVFMCLQVHVCVSACLCVCMYGWMLEAHFGCQSSGADVCDLKTWTSPLAMLAGQQPLGFFFPTPPYPCSDEKVFLGGSWGLNSGPHAYGPSTIAWAIYQGQTWAILIHPYLFLLLIQKLISFCGPSAPATCPPCWS